MNTVNTRIILRNDDLSNWISANPVLSTGEVALARREDGTYDMRIGFVTSAEGGVPTAKTFGELSNSLMLSSQQIIGLDEKIQSLSTTHYVVGDLTDLTGTYVNGDTAVVTSYIDDTQGKEKISYTAYVYDGDVEDWAAMDGNYNASNVYFQKNLTYTDPIGAIPAPSEGSAELQTKGVSLEKTMEMILAKEKSGTTTQPSVALNTSKQTVEYGTAVSATYSFTFSHGSYEYGPDPTGVELSSWVVKTNGHTLDTSTISSDTITNNDVAANPSALTATFDNASQLVSDIYQVSATAGYIGGDTPNNNMGDPDTSSTADKINNGTKSKSGYLYNVYKPTFWRVMTTSINASTPEGQTQLGLTGTITTSSLINKGWSQLSGTSKTSYPVPVGWYAIYFFAPSGWKSNWSGKDTATNLPVNNKACIDIEFTYKNDETEDYRLFRVENDDAGDKTTVAMTFA